MKFGKRFNLSALVLTLSAACGSNSQPSETILHLNWDQLPEIISTHPIQSLPDCLPKAYSLYCLFPTTNGLYSEPTLLLQLPNKPYNVKLEDCDGDGDLDLTFGINGSEKNSQHLHYVATNDG